MPGLGLFGFVGQGEGEDCFALLERVGLGGGGGEGGGD